MSIRLMSDIFSKFPHGGNRKLVLLAIADHANDDGFAWPSVELIAVKCNVSKRYVQEITAELCSLGWLRIARPDADNGRITNLYEVVIPEDAVDAVAVRRAEIKARQKTGRREQKFIVPEYGDEQEFTPGVNDSSLKSSLETSRTVAPSSTDATQAQEQLATLFAVEEQERLAEKTGEPALVQGRTSKTKAQPAAPGVDDWAQLTEGQRFFLECFGAKRYRTKVQADTIKELETEFGYDRLSKKIKWAAQIGMNMGKAIVSVETALRNPKGNPAKRAATVNPGKPGRTKVDITNITNRREM